MERKGDCCIAMHSGGGDSEAAWRMDRTMLRFRPIAPKPAAGSSEASAFAELSPLGRKTRRKSSGAGSRGRKARKVEARPSPTSASASALSSYANITTTTCSPKIVTLPLMPEADERRGDTTERPRPYSGSERPLLPPLPPGWIGCEAAAWAASLVKAVGSWVTVENVTDTWREWEVAWRSDEAVRAALAADECPGLVSDEWDRVTWTNDAYRRMVAGDGSDEDAGGGRAEEEEARVGLVVRAAVPAVGACRAFTCRIRVHYGSRQRRAGRALSSLAAPCDVWRLDDGGRAWRIDVMAALSLSR